eukprot:TRINITY_DN43993_c0_g1_i1.p1 TRINITY_DN43993_c0_g1~~TRINITY_DN43993_c0_g1_i1.p1  ORF type:complete len:807 (-),score=131.01 TRINITY_DN43993_c0_g1_i1:104-2491(-)
MASDQGPSKDVVSEHDGADRFALNAEASKSLPKDAALADGSKNRTASGKRSRSKPPMLGIKSKDTEDKAEMSLEDMREIMNAHSIRIRQLELKLKGPSMTDDGEHTPQGSMVARRDPSREHDDSDSQLRLKKRNDRGGVSPLRKRLAHEQHSDSSRSTSRLSLRDELRTFDHDRLKAIYDTPYRRAQKQTAVAGGGLLGILSMPFGPIGMAAGAMFGGLVGFSVGYIIDRRTQLDKLQESVVTRKRLTSLVRWAKSRSTDEEEIFRLIEVVPLEFKPIADIAEGSKNARKLLRLLESWIAQKAVSRQLWVYTDNLLTHWRDLNRADFLRSMRVFKTLSTMYKLSSRILNDHEKQFVQRLDRLLDNDSVKSVIHHAQSHPTEGERTVMECMVFADAQRFPRPRSRSDGGTPSGSCNQSVCSSPHGSNRDLEHGDLSDDSDDVPEYTNTPRSGVILFSPVPESNLPCVEQLTSETKQVREPIQRVLKQPFFKGWNDFIDFDLTFKHQMPITLSDFDLLVEKSEEGDKGWDICVDRKDIKVWKIQAMPGIITLRAAGTVPGVDILVAFYLFYDISQRVKWDKVFVQMDLIGEPLNGSDILYTLMRVPTITPRDFLQYRRVRILDDGRILIVLRSAVHDAMPEVKGVIRAESYISGYVLEQIWEEGQPVLKIFLMSCTDVRGMIPKWVINYMAPRKPGEWMETLKKAATDYQAENPEYKEELASYVKRFQFENPFDYEQIPEGGLGLTSVDGAQKTTDLTSVPGEARKCHQELQGDGLLEKKVDSWDSSTRRWPAKAAL